VLQNIGDKLSEKETEEFLTEADLDGDGNINYEEFVTMIFKVYHLSIILPHKLCI